MTINGLRNTIRYDEDIFRWAIALLQLDIISKYLPKNKICIFHVLHFAVMAVNFIALYFVFKLLMSSPGLFDFFLILVIALGVYLFELPYKNLAASLVMRFVKANFPVQELENRTLLQLGLELERKFGASPIVDTLLGWTKFFRFVFLLAFISIGRFPLLLYGAWIFRVISRSTMLVYFLKDFREKHIIKNNI